MSVVTAVLALLLGFLPGAVSASEDYLAGRELSPGVGSGDTTYLVLFAGWTLDGKRSDPPPLKPRLPY
jgi:hypothetical protein